MRRSTRQHGFTLLEVLITLVIISVGLLGIAALQVTAQKAEVESYQRSQAMVLLNDIVNRLNTNRRASGCYNTDTSYIGSGKDPVACDAFGVPATQALALKDLQDWDDALEGAAETLDGNNAGGIVNARGCIVPTDTTNTAFIVTVAWQGFTDIEKPAGSSACAINTYGADDGFRRVLSTTVRLADLSS